MAKAVNDASKSFPLLPDLRHIISCLQIISSKLPMSFGFSVGDFFTVSVLAWKCYTACKDSSEDFKALSAEVASLHVVLKESEEHILHRKLDKAEEPHLLEIASNCYEVLSDLDKLLVKYECLAAKSQRTWDRMRWGAEDTQKVRERLLRNVALLTAFNTTVVM